MFATGHFVGGQLGQCSACGEPGRAQRSCLGGRKEGRERRRERERKSTQALAEQLHMARPEHSLLLARQGRVVCAAAREQWVDSGCPMCCRFTSLPEGCPSPASSSAPAAPHPARWPARSPSPTLGTSPASPPAGTPVPWSTHRPWSSPSRAPSSAPALKTA